LRICSDLGSSSTTSSSQKKGTNPVPQGKSEVSTAGTSSVPTAVFQKIPPATGPAPTLKVSPLFTNGLSYFAVARDVPISNKDSNFAIMAVASDLLAAPCLIPTVAPKKRKKKWKKKWK